MFNSAQKEPLLTANRAGNTDLEFNMNSHIRPKNQIFIVQTESNDTVTAKQLEFEPQSGEKVKMPPIPFTRPQRGYAKDCWVAAVKGKEADEEFNVFTLCKSSTDEYLNAGCATAERKSAEGQADYFKLETEDA
jgi:hypothetical protein